MGLRLIHSSHGSGLSVPCMCVHAEGPSGDHTWQSCSCTAADGAADVDAVIQ
jgi:uncharacterized protein YfaP (DUF2135 family)